MSSSSKDGKGLDNLKFQLKDIHLATDNFSETCCIGSGGYGMVYKASLKLDKTDSSIAIGGNNKGNLREKHSTVAIKRIVSENVEHGKQGFLAEIEMLTNCRHPNIVSLHGYCDEEEEMILIYEYVPNGSLAHYLENIHKKPNLTWAQRIKICLDIAYGLKYLHSNTEDKKPIIHRDIKSDNILLDENWVAKIADFGLSRLHHASQQRSTIVTKKIAGTPLYLDPEYMESGRLKTKSDVYSFGVVMFEIMCGKMAHDETYGRKGLPSIARQCFSMGTIYTLVDVKIMEADDDIFKLIGRVDQDSLEIFTKVAYDCLAETQSERPTLEVVIKELEKALELQKTRKDDLRISLEAIKLGTQNFSECNCIGEGRFWKLYEGQIEHANKCTTIIAKRWDTTTSQGHIQLLNEFHILSLNKHENIIGLVGYCIEESENIIVYEHASNGRLDKRLGDPSLTWTKRLEICIDVAKGLSFLHKDSVEHEDSMIHRGIRSDSILLNSEWNAKISNFELSRKTRVFSSAEDVDGNDCKPLGYVDPYHDDGLLLEKSDIYSFGVILVEMLCGRLTCVEGCEDHSRCLGPSAVRHYNENGNIDEMIFEGIQKQIVPQSMTIYQMTATQCLQYDRRRRPNALGIVTRLEKALELQKTIEINSLHISLNSIKLGTQNFSDCNCIGEGRFWKLYEGQVELATKGCIPIIAKRWDRKSGQGHIEFLKELDTLPRYEHKNIITLVGYCVEMGESIIVYEHASNGRLDKHLGDLSLTSTKRLKIGIDVANALIYLHSNHVHRDIKSGSILLDGDWNAKISNFELSCKIGICERAEHVDDNDCNSLGYIDPEYQTLGYLSENSDIYSLGVILIEMFCGRLAWGEGCEDHYQSLGPLAFRHFNKNGNLDEMMLEGIKKQIPPRSLAAFEDTVIGCLKKSSRRSRAREVVKLLEHALKRHEEMEVDKLHISLEAIKLGTQHFNDRNCIGERRCWKLYKGEVENATNGCTPIVAKRWDTQSSEAYFQFWTELDILSRCRHNNFIGLVGYCIEMNEYIIVYEHTSNGRLDKHLGDPSLTWKKRLKICLDVAKGLAHLLKGTLSCYVHKDFNGGCILLDGDWNAKISNFEFSYVSDDEDETSNNRVKDVDYNYCDSLAYGYLTEKSDIYALGVVLIEMLCGRLALGEGCEDHSQSLGPLALKHYYEKKCFDEMIFEGIKEQIGMQSMAAFELAAIKCLMFSRYIRLSEVVSELAAALEFQEEHETWIYKLPVDYKEIIRASKTPDFFDSIKTIKIAQLSDIYKFVKTTKDLYDMFLKGILHRDGKVLFSLGSNGERNEMISARMFCIKNRRSHKWRSVQESRFEKVAEIFDVSKLKTRIKIRTQFLSPGVHYGAYIIFKFCDERKFSSKPMYVNLKYKRRREKLQAYFATWRDDKWMMIELCRFLCDKKETDFDVMLESFSRYHCGNSCIYVEGIEFRAIDKVKNEENSQVQQNLISYSNEDQLLLPNEVNRKKHLMLSAMEVLHDASNVKHFHLQPLVESRFQEVIVLLPQHVFRINCKIQSQMLSQDTKYLCYLVFKLSEKCTGLHCPVIVRDLVRRNKKEAEIIYFRTPRAWNIHENISVPIQREDGWMEVKVWEFNSNYQLKNDCIMVNLKLITYEGTMSGLIVCGLELRPM